MQRVEIGDAVDANDDSLAVDDEMLHPVLQCGFNDPRISLGPVISVTRDQPDPIAIALDTQAVAVEFDFMKPILARGHGFAGRRQAELELGHGPKIGISAGNCESANGPAARSSMATRPPTI